LIARVDVVLAGAAVEQVIAGVTEALVIAC